MKLTLDQIVHKKLVLVKQLYHQAVLQSSTRKNMIGRIMSVICFDLAVETLLKTIISAIEPSKKTQNSFHDLIKQANDLLNKASYPQIPDEAKIKHVHAIRNDAQHKAKYPNETDVIDCRVYIRDFLQECISNLWNATFDSISLTALIQHDGIKKLLVEAEEFFNNGEYIDSVKRASAGLTLGLNKAKTAFVGQISDFLREVMVKEPFGNIQSSSEIHRAIVRMQNTLLYVALGMNYSDYMNCKQIFGNVVFTIDGTAHHSEMQENIGRDDAEFVLSYCSNTLIEIENQIDDFDRPFGKMWF